MDYIDLIKRKRNELGVSQEKLAEKLNVSRNTIIRWESKEVDVPLKKYLKICEELKIHVDISGVDKSKFNNAWRLFNKQEKVTHSFLIKNTTNEKKIARIFGKFQYLLSKNFGSDEGVLVAPLKDNFTYLQYLNEFSERPFVIDEINIKTKGETTVVFNCANKYGKVLIERNHFKDYFFQKSTEFEIDLNKVISGLNSWEISLSPKQRIEIKIKGKQYIYG